MTTTKLTWTIKYQTTTGQVKIARWKTETYAEAVDLTCSEYSVANVLECWQGKTRWW